MAQYTKSVQNSSAAQPDTTITEPASIAAEPAQTNAGSSVQPTMRRYIHSIPLPETAERLLSNQHSPLLQAMEQQNALLTDLISAVNGLTSLLCSRSSL